MRQALRTFGRILARHAPALVAWYLGGEAVHRVLVQVAGFVGGHTTLGGLLLLPLAVAARLVSYVAMYLTVRSSLPNSLAEGAGTGYRSFGRSVVGAILPFTLFYAAWGMLDADLRAFFAVASSVAFAQTGNGVDEALGDRGGLISAGPLPVLVLVAALALRLVLDRFRDRLPSWALVLAAYAEVLWTFMLFTLVGQWWSGVRAWFSGRAGAQWLEGIGAQIAAAVPPLGALWEGGLWLVGIVAAAVIVPAAWLAVAGVIFGADLDTTPTVLHRRAEALRGAAGGLSRTLLRRLEDLWAALAAIWRGGPLLFGLFAAAYAVWAAAERIGTRALLQAVGGHESNFWAAFFPLLLVAVAAVAEPLRVALVATAFDAVVGRRQAGVGIRTAAPATDSRIDAEAGDLVLDGDVEPERPPGVVG
ncbi:MULTISPECIES: hypothetical protein [unclassified Microbacterium]|uniref:hypothetical protein n=1 Tax=unclassified Microbacterium TaxID=2609290 RepID=UPI00300FB634